MLNCAKQSLSLFFKYYRIIKTHNQPSLSEFHYITKMALGRNLPLILCNCHGLIYEYYFLNYWSQIISNIYDNFLINPQIYVIISLQFNKCNYKIYQHNNGFWGTDKSLFQIFHFTRTEKYHYFLQEHNLQYNHMHVIVHLLHCDFF